jgi:hypothetical protein
MRAPNGGEAGQDDSVDLRSGLRTVYEVCIHRSSLRTVHSSLPNGIQNYSLSVASVAGSETAFCTRVHRGGCHLISPPDLVLKVIWIKTFLVMKSMTQPVL